MSGGRPKSMDRYQSALLKQYGDTLEPNLLRALDQNVANMEAQWLSQIAGRDRAVDELQRELDETKEKLKHISESRFRSVERELATADSQLAGKYKNLIGDIKTLVLNLMKLKSAEPGSKNLLNIIKDSTQYREGLQAVLEPNLSVQQFVALLEKSKAETKILGFILRAIIMNLLRSKLFNANVFLCLGGENWKQLRGVYLTLLGQEFDESNPLEPEILIKPENDRYRRDASLWRSQTVHTLSRNAERLGLKAGHAKVFEDLVSRIEELLTPLAGADAKDAFRSDIISIVGSAADLAVELGKQRAMFELESKKYLGPKFAPQTMDPFGPWAEGSGDDDDDDDEPRKPEPSDVIAVIFPALFKFGNDDGEEFSRPSVVLKAQCLVIPSSQIEQSKPRPVSTSGAPAVSEAAKDAAGDSAPAAATKDSAPAPIQDASATSAAATDSTSAAPKDATKDDTKRTLPEDLVEQKTLASVIGDKGGKARVGSSKEAGSASAAAAAGASGGADASKKKRKGSHTK